MTKYPTNGEQVNTGVNELAGGAMPQIVEVNMWHPANCPGALE
ncbi:hypothetical protein LT85_1940 [Collimonas arenae]|uniref:Uncharacterized protein n=1 Tax=Collimonas arenae TaxID=279058 RepID=A0A0A1F8N5_9BURK|nr:hypothetical protein [Collimonas arenae]AIY41098.1 hypothetical protein LT85_1940 [Collimonas arenae]